MEDRVILLADCQTLRDLVEQETKRKWILVVWMEGNVFHCHRCRYQSLIIALVTDTALIEVALDRVSHANAEIMLIRRASDLISYLELAYFSVLKRLVDSVIVQGGLICDSIRLEGADRVGI